MTFSAFGFDALTKLFEQFYLGFLRDDAQLQQGLVSLSRYFQADNAHIAVRHRDRATPLLRYACGTMAEDYRLFNRFDTVVAPLDPYLAQVCDPENVGKAFLTAHVPDGLPPDLASFYADIRERAGWRYMLSGAFFNEDRQVGYVRFVRPEEAGPFSADAVAALNHILPHLGTSCRMREAFSQVYASLERILFHGDEREAGVIYLDRDSRIVMVNDCARQLFAGMDGLYLRGGTVAAADWKETEAIEALITNSIASTRVGKVLPTRTEATVTRPSGREPYQIQITPVVVQNRFTEQNAIVSALRIIDPDAEAKAGLSGNIQDYQLTAAEARLARFLVAGLPPKEVARQTGLSVHTIRTQQRGLYRKLGVSRHFDLLMRLSPDRVG